MAVLVIVIGASSYGLLSSFIKFAYYRGFGDAQISLSQILVGTMLVWVLLAFTRRAWGNPFRGPWIRLSLIGIFGLALTTILYNISLSELDASLSIVLLFQFTWITIAMDCIVSKRRLRRQELLAVLVIAVGTIMAVNIFAADWTRFTLKGVFFGLLSGFTYSLFLFLTGRVQSEMHYLMKSAVMLTATVPFVLVMYPPANFAQEAGLELLAWGLLLGLLGQVIPTIAFNIGIPKVGSSLAAMLGSIELPIGVIAAFLLLGEPVMGSQWVGMALIMVGIVISEYKS
jgi:drug/metabolite transporter (DMT)-like permease